MALQRSTNSAIARARRAAAAEGDAAAAAVGGGDKIVITLKADASEFADPARVGAVIKKYSLRQLPDP